MPSSKHRSSAFTETDEKKCRQYRSNSYETIFSESGEKVLKLKMRVVKLRSSMGSRIAFRALKILQPRSELKKSWKRLLQAVGTVTLGDTPSFGRKRSVIQTIKPSCPPSQMSICPPSNLFISQVSLRSSRVILLARYYKMRKQPSSITPSNQSPSDCSISSGRLMVGQASKQLTVRWMWLWKSSQMERYESSDSVSALKPSLVVLSSMALVLCSFAEGSMEAVRTLLS